MLIIKIYLIYQENKDSTTNRIHDNEINSYLEKLKQQPLSHFTLLNIDKINENIPDIDRQVSNEKS